MSLTHAFNLDLDNGLRKPGDLVAGIVDVDEARASELNIDEIRVELLADVKTQIRLGTGDAAIQSDDRKSLMTAGTFILWKRDNTATEQIRATTHKSYPFTFTLPNNNLPPSFHIQSGEVAASVRYYIRVTGSGKGRDAGDIRINRPFPFLPYDDNPFVDELRAVEHRMIKTVRIPDLESLPLFTKIPVVIVLRGVSKILSSSSALNSSRFTFPIPPTSPKYLELRLFAVCTTVAQAKALTFRSEVSLMGGLGKLDMNIPFEGSPKEVAVDIEPPEWIAEAETNANGRWSQLVTFRTDILFRGTPTFKTSLVKLDYELDLKVVFPGIGNDLKTTICLPPISSGLHRSQLSDDNQSLDLPPAYWEVIDEVDYPKTNLATDGKQ
ncbi:hypothetical protein SISNIDRAFT_486446 [Sistotremastrum niveocremeum HHB9708]|uniref:Arrestin-like N-terminal domain-containing protein n=1 Tax=Sistotremastrum niveocremeum HHB9708 TaxID=1314777 RepID=A0A164TJ78_9AGAM|nr:hypothetical protein SISNIDRAFT_486446 [Sistotremastrum niveocremeum HHB9708]